MLKNVIITSRESGGNVDYKYDFFREGFEEWARNLDASTPYDTDLLKQYLTERGYRVTKIKEDMSTKKELKEFEKKFGLIKYEGKKYILLEEADFTSNQLPGNWNYNDVEAGEEYQFQMKAEATNESGEKLYDVFWIFWEVKGDEKLPEDFDYDNVNHVEEIEIEYYHYNKYGFFTKPEEF